ncbi:MAG: (d)CMP kinase [Clostridiaceae bacterium]
MMAAVRNVIGLIRTEEVGNMASATSVYKKVREKLVELQKDLAKKADVIMDGRDIGTCVLPDADVKVYLTASSAVRAKRRYHELKEKGTACDLDEIEKDIIDRDYRDMHRENSPLKQADDAVLLDSSDMTLKEVVEDKRGSGGEMEVVARRGFCLGEAAWKSYDRSQAGLTGPIIH